MILLDTNVLSAVMQRQPDPVVVAWLDSQAPESVWTTAVTVFEIRFGIELLRPSRRRNALEAAFDAMLRDDLGGRIAMFDSAAAEEAAKLAARRQRRGRPVDLRDTQIAGIALARRAALATRNVRHFEGLNVNVVSPWTR
ncbi:MAG TPA: type II toxin-antitoxin system VapC family toxin [Methylomirabilota bacterium]|nr:type II toxin-antitoxin system VapC family toxin [Methylomirabilota bacterium]